MKYEDTKEAKQEGLVYLIGSILLIIVMLVLILDNQGNVENKIITDKGEQHNDYIKEHR
jgi:hypothetical protein